MEHCNPESPNNPIFKIGREELLAWIRGLVDDAGFSDRDLLAMQIQVSIPFAGGQKIHGEVPELVVMASNVEGSRTETHTAMKNVRDTDAETLPEQSAETTDASG